MYLSKTPAIVKPISKHLVWNVQDAGNKIYLTFDDGPTPDVTSGVLSLLDAYQAKATFFCIGKNVIEHPEIFQRTVLNGHSVANHSFSHENGWKTNNRDYYKSYLKCAEIVDSRLFRPPYGKITQSQARAIGKRSNIIMWDVLSGDFDPKTNANACARRVIKNTRPGSIIVFHDSFKAKDKMLPALEQCLDHFSDKGFEFDQL